MTATVSLHRLATVVLSSLAIGFFGCGLYSGSTESPRALTPRELANITAFANALGYIRFFHPTDAAVNVNWDAFAVRGIRVVQRATSDDSLASALKTVFGPITSNVRCARDNRRTAAST